MSQENMEILRAMLEQARDKPEALYEILDDEVEWHVSMEVGLEGGAYHGPEGVREFFRTWAGTFDDWDFEADEYLVAGESVIVRIHQWGRGRGSGAPVQQHFWQVWTFRNGKIIRQSQHREKVQALEAAGLRE